MSGLSWAHRGRFKRQRELRRFAADEVRAGEDVEIEHPMCDGYCSFCIRDWDEREAIWTRLLFKDFGVPMFMIAERLLARVGIVLRQAC